MMQAPFVASRQGTKGDDSLIGTVRGRADCELILYMRVEDVYGPGNISGSIDPLV